MNGSPALPWPGRIAWTLAGLAIALQTADFVFSLASDAVEPPVAADLIISAITLAFSAVGALVASRQPRNPIGWMFLGVALSAGLARVAHHFVEHRVSHGADQDTLVGAAAAYSDVSWVPFVLVPATLLLLLFPDGRLPSRRWRFVAGCAIAGIVGTFFTGAAVQSFQDFPTVKSPFAINGSVREPLTGSSFLLVLIGVVGSAASVVARYRRAGRVQRQQIKWLAAAGAAVAVTLPLMFALYDVLPDGVADAGIMLSVLALPAAAGVAMLRYRLYDIEVVVNRTLVYGALTATLAGTYVVTVLVLQLGLNGVTGDSGLAVAGSTLVVAGLFRPARAHIQGGVDRRFYRRKYDAQRTVEAFSARLRNEVDLGRLDEELSAVVHETFQPAHVSLWLRGSAG
jgi:hypothetical protein